MMMRPVQPRTGRPSGGTRPGVKSPIRGGTGKTKTVPAAARADPSKAPTLRFLDNVVSDQIDYLQKQCEQFTKRIDVENRRVEDLDKKIKISKTKLADSRRILSGMDNVAETRARTKALHVVENRLNKALVRYNSAVTDNNKLKRLIEDLRLERIQKIGIRKKLEKKVREKKQSMVDMVHESREAADARDRYEREIQLLQATIQREVADFEDEFTLKIQELQAEEPTKLDRVKVDPTSTDASILPFGMASHHYGAMTVEQELELKHKSTKSYWDIAKREVDLKKQSAQLQKYEEAFAKIQAETGIQTIDEMVAAFCAAEDHNFSLINMINDLNQEIEELEVANSGVRDALKEAKEKGADTDEARSRIFKSLEDQIAAAEGKALGFNERYESALHSMESMKPGILSIFQKVGCSDEATAETLIATGVTDSNIMQFLGLVEQRITEIVQMHSMSLAGQRLTYSSHGTGEKKRPELSAADVGRGPAASSNPAASGPSASEGALHSSRTAASGFGATARPGRRLRKAVNNVPAPPSLGDLDVSSDEEEDELATISKPMSINELKSHTAALLNKKQAKAERKKAARTGTTPLHGTKVSTRNPVSPP